MERSLSHTIQSLKDILEKGSDNPETSLSQMTERLEEALSLSQANSMIFLNKSDNLSYFLKECSPNASSSSNSVD